MVPIFAVDLNERPPSGGCEQSSENERQSCTDPLFKCGADARGFNGRGRPNLAEVNDLLLRLDLSHQDLPDEQFSELAILFQ